MLAAHRLPSFSYVALAAAVACGAGCATPSKTARPGPCEAAALVATWERPADGLVMDLLADGCSIRGTADNPAFRHTIEGTYDPDARTVMGTIRRTNVASGCVTIMRTTWMLTDPRHLNMAIIGTDGACELPPGYHEVSTLVRQCACGKR